MALIAIEHDETEGDEQQQQQHQKQLHELWCVTIDWQNEKQEKLGDATLRLFDEREERRRKGKIFLTEKKEVVEMKEGEEYAASMVSRKATKR